MTHSGGDTGFVSNLVLIPDKSIAVVMMSNFDRAPLGRLRDVLGEIEAEDTGEASAELASLSVALRTMRSALAG